MLSSIKNGASEHRFSPKGGATGDRARRLQAGARINELTDEYGVPEADLLDVLRAHIEAA
jgi:hypothetical protein